MRTIDPVSAIVLLGVAACLPGLIGAVDLRGGLEAAALVGFGSYLATLSRPTGEPAELAGACGGVAGVVALAVVAITAVARHAANDSESAKLLANGTGVALLAGIVGTLSGAAIACCRAARRSEPALGLSE